jgi:hypothetical protein
MNISFPFPRGERGRMRGVYFFILQSTFSDPQLNHAPIAQMDRASDYESAGRVFESPWARQFFLKYFSDLPIGLFFHVS